MKPETKNNESNTEIIEILDNSLDISEEKIYICEYDNWYSE